MRSAIFGASLLDVNKGQLVKDPVVVIEGNRIREVSTKRRVRIEEGDVKIDLTGKTLLPGLIDSHVHLGQIGALTSTIGSVEELIPFQTARAVDCLRRDMEAGFTSIRTACDKGFLDVGLKQAISAGFIKGPRLFTCGHMLTVTGGRDSFVPGLHFPQSRFMEFDGPNAGMKAARTQLKYDVDWVKLGVSGAGILGEANPGVQQMTLEELQAIAKVTHAVGKKVFVHAHDPSSIKDCVRAGIDSIEHGWLADDEAISMLADSGTYLVPTFAPMHHVLEKDVEGGIPKRTVERYKRMKDILYEGFLKAIRAGVRMVMGTDTGMAYNYHGNNALEIQLMADAGLGNLEAIRSASTVAAEMLGIHESCGSIEAGKFADIIAVNGNPLEDIQCLRDVPFVMKDGEIIKHIVGGNTHAGTVE